MRFDIPIYALAAAAGLFVLSVAVAQTAAPPAPAMAFADPPHKNLKILPKDIARQDLIGTMKFFSQSLGVRCTFCHVGAEGQPISTYDFASDTKDEKRTARAMMTMVAMLNDKTLPAATGVPDAKVTCFTCHRGSKKPELAPAAVEAIPAAPAPPPPAAKSERG